MKNLKNYSLHEIIYKQPPYVFYKASREDSADSFIIKTIDFSNDPNKVYYSNLLHEFSLLRNLTDLSNYIFKIIEFVEDEELAGLVYKNEEFSPLSSLFSNEVIDFNLFFIITIQIANALIEIHKHGIVHKNITLDSIFFNSAQNAIQIHDFSIASQLKRTMVSNEVVTVLQGNLAYIAPEQTGKVNRPLTQRADLYSLGVAFYALLTGQLPFTKQNSAELVLEHIATQPKPPHEINPAIPEQLSLIVLKLLSKTAENRYKSALGLHADLERAWIEFKDKHTISLFPLAKDDIAMRLELPDKLYGRDAEIKILSDTFDSFCKHNENTLLIISGYSGVGKTSLIRELIERITIKNGLFADGKFDKFERSDPYAALRIALNKIVTYKLSLSEPEITHFKHTLSTELSNVLDVITDFIPSLQAIIGRTEKSSDIGIEQTKNRFEMAIQRFISIVSQSQPIVLFLDDLQWANYSLFDLLDKILLSKQIHNVFLVISYRSNEVVGESPVIKFIDSISAKKTPQMISIQGLSNNSIVELLHDMLYIRAESIQPLAELLFKKTEGNPFFLLMLLEELYKDGKIIFSEQRNTWSWQEEDIASFAASDNVVEFVNHRLTKLPHDCKSILQCAACIGNHFSLEELSISTEKSYQELAQILQPALQAGLIVPTNTNYEWFEGVHDDTLKIYKYYFQHDRIQQSCYHLLTKEEAEKQHLTIARNWCQHYIYQDDPMRTMLITEQFNKGLSHVKSDEEKQFIRDLNYQSGQIAMASIAYEMAYHYDSFAVSLLPNRFIDKDYSAWFNTYHHYIKSAFLSHHFKESEQICEYVLSIIENNFDKAKILFLKGDLARTAGDKSSISYFEKGLTIMGYADIAAHPGKIDVIKRAISFKLYLRKYDLDTLPIDTEEQQYFIYYMATHLAQECYYAGDILRWAYIFLTWGIRTFPYHNKELRALCLGIHAIIWPHSKKSYELFQKSIPILTQTSKKELAIGFYFAGSVLHLAWHQPFAQCMSNFKKSIDMGEQCGDLEFCARAYLACILALPDKNIPDICKEISRVKNIVFDISYRTFLNFLLYDSFYFRLSGENSEMSNQSYDEMIGYFEKTNYIIGMHNMHLIDTNLAIHFEEFSVLEKEKPYLDSNIELINKSNNTLISPSFHFYFYLTLIELYPKESFINKIKLRLKLVKLRKRLRKWSMTCPENLLAHCILLDAEWAGISNRIDTALTHFNTAATLAEKYEWLELIALSYHRALLLCIRHNCSEKKEFYLNKAISAYTKWGALNVVSMLKEKYGHK